MTATVILHRADTRGESDIDWLSSRFSFSFAEWHEPSRMNFGLLRVLNDDVVAPHTGFGMHPHHGYEIITIVTEGAVTHSDSLGTNERVERGEVQVMSAGSGIIHSEYNNEDVPLKLFQLWIASARPDAEPRYDQRAFDERDRNNVFQLLVSGDEDTEALMIYQDARIYRARISTGSTIEHAIRPERGVYAFVVAGSVRTFDYELHMRDALGIEGAERASFEALEDSDVLLIEVPMEE